MHLLPAEWYYRLVTFHGLNMLILWILFFEVAILYFASTVLLKTRLAWPGAAKLAFGLMLFGALLIEGSILRDDAPDAGLAWSTLPAF